MHQAKSNSAILSLLGTSLLLAACAGGGDGGASPIVPPPVVSTPANIVIARGIGDNCPFVLGGDIYLAKEDGSGALVTLANTSDFEEFKATTPGGRVIYQRHVGSCAQSDLYSVNADGTVPVLLAASADFSGITASGRAIYSTFVGPVEVGNSDLYSVNADGSDTQPLAVTGAGENFRGITSSGRVIYRRDVGGQSDLYSVNADGTGTVALAISLDHEDFCDSCFGKGGITSSGRVVYSRLVGGQVDIHSVNADGSDPQILANTVGNENFNGLTPAGQVVYQGVNSPNFGLYSINADGTGTTVTLALGDSTSDEVFVGTSPDGRVIYQSVIRSGAGAQLDLYSVNADGSGRRALAISTDNEAFSGITPGGRVIYWRLVGGTQFQYDLYSVNADGTGTVVLSSTGNTLTCGIPGCVAEPYPIAIAPGGRVIFWRVVSIQSDLHSINADGSGEVVLANTLDHEYIRNTTNNGQAIRNVTPGGRVIYERYIGGNNYDIYSVNVDGTGTGTQVLGNTPDREEFYGIF